MAGDSHAKLTRLASEILRQAIEVFNYGDDRWLVGDNTGSFAALSASFQAASVSGSLASVSGSFAALTGSFPTLTGSFQALGSTLTGSFQSLGNGNSLSANAGPGLKKAFQLPSRLPATRLPSSAQLATMARSAPLMAELEKLARWLGRDERLVTADHELSAADAADAAVWVGVKPQYLPYLLDYALTAGWLVLNNEPDGSRTWMAVGETAWRWADGDDSGALYVWAAVFAAVLARTLDVAASRDPRASRKLEFRGQGVATAVRLFLARRAGLSGADIRDLIMSGALGDGPTPRGRRAWDGWVRGYGDPAQWLLGELAALGAIRASGADDGTLELTPVALWALCEQLRLDGVEVRLLKSTSTEMSAATLVAFVDGVSEAEGNAEFASWVGARGPDRAAHELLALAAFSGPQPRLGAVNLVRRIGPAAQPAWRDAMQRPELRGYAWIALTANRTQGAVPPDARANADDLNRVATDLLALACGDEAPDPQEIAAQLDQAIPQGEQSWVLSLMSRSSHPDVARLLTALGWYHPNRRIARVARRAARGANRRWIASQALARAFGR